MSNSDDFVFPSEMSKGLTKREYFAAMALQGLVSTHSTNASDHLLADLAVSAADALLERLENDTY